MHLLTPTTKKKNLSIIRNRTNPTIFDPHSPVPFLPRRVRHCIHCVGKGCIQVVELRRACGRLPNRQAVPAPAIHSHQSNHSVPETALPRLRTVWVTPILPHKANEFHSQIRHGRRCEHHLYGALKISIFDIIRRYRKLLPIPQENSTRSFADFFG